MRAIYSAILYLLLPFILLRLFIRSFGNPARSLRWHERLGYLEQLRHDDPLIWIHAVSVGEVRAAKPLIDALHREYPASPVMVTTMTATGTATVKQLFDDTVRHCYIPYDLPGAVRRFIQATRPSCMIVMETELWPNLFHYCRVINVPVILANGRMSMRSARGYRLLSRLTRSTLQSISLIGAQSVQDAERFIELGAATARVTVTGNLKYDFAQPDDFHNRLDSLRSGWPSRRPIWIAASTHDGEDQIVLKAHAMLLKEYPECLLILAPRHPERCNAVVMLCDKSGFRTVRKTENPRPDDSVCVFVLDSMGELVFYYALAWLAFVGGSLVDVGGHNMLEPAALGLPVITGPYLHNFHEIGNMLQSAGCASVVHDERELAAEVMRLFSNEKLRHDAGQRGRDIVLANRGSVERIIKLIRPVLNQCATNPAGLI